MVPPPSVFTVTSKHSLSFCPSLREEIRREKITAEPNNRNVVLVDLVLPSRGSQVPHDVHGLHGVIHHMTALHKLLCRLPVDDFGFRNTAIPGKHVTSHYLPLTL